MTVELKLCLTCQKLHATGTTCPGCGAPLTLEDERFFTGMSFGKYTVEGVLGSGGMGVVFKAVHQGLNRPAALKMILPGLAGEESQFIQRFSQEARVLARLKHPNIVEVYDYDLSPWGFPYCVMEYLDGSTLRQEIGRRGGDPSLRSWAPVLRDVSAALTHAHAMGIIHRDLKPENIFIARFGNSAVGKVLDFGIAKILGAGQDTGSITATGSVIGTPNYLAPEQILGQEVGPFTDQYALALIVAELSSGRAVRAGKTFGEICAKDIHRPLPEQVLLDTSAPAEVMNALRRATLPDPKDRFPDIARFMAALGMGGGDAAVASALAGAVPETVQMTTPAASGPKALPEPAPPPRAPEPPLPGVTSPRKVFRPLLQWGAVALGALAVAVALIGRFWHSPRSKATAESPPAAILEKLRDVAVPADADRLLTREQDTLVIEGAGCVYLLTPAASQAPARVPLGPGQKVMGALPSGAVLFQDGPRLVAKDLLDNKETVLAAKLPAAERLEISPDGRLLACFSEEKVTLFSLDGGECSKRLDVSREKGRLWDAMITGAYLIWLEGDRLKALRLDTGKLALDVPFDSPDTGAIAVQDQLGLLAVGGRQDAVTLYGLNQGKVLASIPSRGDVGVLRFLPDAPTLLIGSEWGLRLWRPEKGVVSTWGDSGDPVCSALFDGIHLAALDRVHHQLHLFAYRDLPVGKRVELSKKDIWALAAEPGTGRIFAGGADGNLYACDLASGRVETKTLHTQGITSMALQGANLATCSDDKTIAVWKLPGLELTWRSKAHAFLVNALCLGGDPPSLWSSSSDGSVKRWSWPQLEDREELSVGKLTGSPKALHAIWASSDGNLVLVGTWKGSLLVMRRGGKDGWEVKEYKIPSQVIYSMAPMPDIQAVLMVGIYRTPGIFVFDLKEGRFGHLDNLDCWSAIAAVASPDGRGAWVLGDGTLMQYRFARDGAGDLTYSVGARFSTELGTVSAATFQASRNRLVLGDGDGGIRTLGPEGLDVPAFVTEKVLYRSDSQVPRP